MRALPNALEIGLVVTALGFGFRHGFDWDHIAAITDITSSQVTRKRSIYFATLYALGHAIVVFALGFAAIVLASKIPDSIDSAMERLVGVTLVLLGGYVFYGLVRHGRDFRMRSRWMLIFDGIHKGFRWTRARMGREGRGFDIEHEHPHELDEEHHLERERRTVPIPASASPPSSVDDSRMQTHRHIHRHHLSLSNKSFMKYGSATSLVVGMIHGIGAETPTQVLIFLSAAGAGGRAAGVLLLIVFLVGLLAANSLIAIAGAYGFLGAERSFPIYVTVSVLTAVFSLVVGVLFILGKGTLLPAIFTG